MPVPASYLQGQGTALPLSPQYISITPPMWPHSLAKSYPAPTHRTFSFFYFKAGWGRDFSLINNSETWFRHFRNPHRLDSTKHEIINNRTFKIPSKVVSLKTLVKWPTEELLGLSFCQFYRKLLENSLSTLVTEVHNKEMSGTCPHTSSRPQPTPSVKAFVQKENWLQWSFIFYFCFYFYFYFL